MPLRAAKRERRRSCPPFSCGLPLATMSLTTTLLPGSS
jgi:hypothetical protein